jgi:hypothetical protein
MHSLFGSAHFVHQPSVRYHFPHPTANSDVLVEQGFACPNQQGFLLGFAHYKEHFFNNKYNTKRS